MPEIHGSAPIPERLYLREGEAVALMHATEGHPDRALPLGFGPAGAWLVRDASGHFPRWALDHLAQMRGIANETK